ncbi:hypothetical protein DFP72DRAFT_771091, partial [Ephemerocybe angulata]
FTEAFNFPLFPADLQLVQPFLLEIEKRSRCISGSLNTDYMEAHAMAYVLFCTVLTRTVLGCEPCHDTQIFYLAFASPDYPKATLSPDEIALVEGRLARRPSVYEQAIAASI